MASDKKNSVSQKYCPQWSQLDLFPQLLQQERCRLNRLRESKRSKKRSTSRERNVHRHSRPLGTIVAVSEKGVRIGEDHPFARWTDTEVDQILELRGEGRTIRAIAKIMEMPSSTVWAICSGLIRGKVPAGFRKVK